MLSFLTVLCLSGALLFPTFMLCITYPLSHKWALFWSDYITSRTARLVFAILKYYRHFEFLGSKNERDGLPEQFVVVSNHQSLLDIVVYFKFFSDHVVRFVAKDTLGKVPMVGKMLRSQEHCMIPRKGGAALAMKSIERLGERVLERGQIPVIFPEGTRSRDGNLGQFYSAGFRRLEETVKLPVAVCALDGGWKISELDSILRNLYKGAYRVKILKVYPAPQSKAEEKQILEEAPHLIQAQLDKWRALPDGSLEV